VDAWFVYVARCADDTLYVGIARDVSARLAAHDAGRGAKYTRGRGPLVLLTTKKCSTKGDALRLELAIKRLRREEKLALAASRARLSKVAKLVSLAARSKPRPSPARKPASRQRPASS
jgi:putative endonuclease